MGLSNIVDLWRLIMELYKPGKISDRRKNYYSRLKSYMRTDPPTVIDDPYHALKGISLYKLIKYGEGPGIKKKAMKKEFSNMWSVEFGTPESFADFQVRLLSLFIINYKLYMEGIVEYESYIEISDISKAIEHLTHRWERAGAIYVDRMLFYYLLKRPSKVLSSDEKKKAYKWLTELHDLLSTMNLISTPPYSQQRSRPVFGLHEGREYSKARSDPGKAFELMPTTATIFVSKRLNELLSELTCYEDSRVAVQALYKRLEPLKLYYELLMRSARNCLEESINSKSGVSLTEAVEFIVREIPDEIRGSVSHAEVLIRHEVASMIIWLSEVNDMILDPLSFNIGLVKIINVT